MNLFDAVESGDIEKVKTLLKDGADVNKANNDGGTPLYLAAYWGHNTEVGKSSP